MKASKNQNLSPSMRYKLAAMKRFTNFMFWGPPLIIGSVLFIVWQYQQHPEWLLGGEGETLAPTTQFEEPGIYDNLPEGTLAPSTLPNGQEGLINPNINPNPPSALNPNPELEANNFTNPLVPSGQKKSSDGKNPGSQLPDLFLPLFPTQNKQNQANIPSPSLPSRTSPIKIEVNQESELQKAMRRRFSSQGDNNASSPQTNPQSPTSQQPSSQYTYPNPNNPVTSNQGISSYNPYSQPVTQPNSFYQNPNNPTTSPNHQSPYAPQPVTPYGYRPLPSGSYYNSGGQSNPSNPYGGQPVNRYGQSSTTPNYGNNYRNNYGTSTYGATPNQVPTINGRPAPQIQPSLPSRNFDY